MSHLPSNNFKKRKEDENLKRKTVTKLFLFSAVLGMALLSEAAEASILDAPGLIIPTANDTVKAKYSFIAGFNEEKTETITFGKAKFRTLEDDGTLKEKGYSSKVAVLNPAEQDNPDDIIGSGVIYTHSGNWEGKDIDLKLTITGFTAPSEGNHYGNIMLGLDNISLNSQDYNNIDFTLETFEHGTTETDNPIAVDLSGFMTVNDNDAGQFFALSPETAAKVPNIYISSDSNKVGFRNDGGKYVFYDAVGAFAEPDDLDYTFTFLYDDTSKLELSWGHQTKTGVTTADLRPDTISGDYFGYIAKKPLRTETLIPTKLGTDNDETLVEDNTLSTATESWLYTITHQVPDEYKDFYYSSYAFKDTVLDVLDIAEESFIIMNELDEDVTNWFNVTIQDNVIEYQAKPETLLKAEFYNHYYRTMFSVRVKDGADVSPYLDETGTLTFENQATVSVNGEEKETNKTVTKYKEEAVIESSEPEPSSTTEPSTVESSAEPKNIPDTSSGSNMEVIGIAAMVSATISLLFNILGKKKAEDEE